MSFFDKSALDPPTVPARSRVSNTSHQSSTWFSSQPSQSGSAAIHSVHMSTPTPTEFNPLAGLAAAIFPGAGHLVLGKPRRAFFAAIGVMGLFFFGLFIGGIDAIDSKQDKIWFYGQTLVGAPTIIVDQIHQGMFKADDPETGRSRTGFPGEHRLTTGPRPVWEPLTSDQIQAGMGPPNTPGLGRLNEIAMLSIVLAGMLNLIIFLDALMPAVEPSQPNTSGRERPETGDETNGGTGHKAGGMS